MATQKLYWSDPFATAFDDASARVGRYDESHTSLVLDRTLFYPESGGQLADAGTLVVGERTFHVRDVQIADDGTIHHLTTEPLTDGDLAGPARGDIDGARRLDHMVHHTAQHALSRALVDVARAETVSARLGATSCTIDVEGDVDDRGLARAEDLVNAVVRSDVVVRQLFPTAAELAGMALRRPPKVDQNVRIIEIEGFDLSPCGGTHCTRSGQLGFVRVAGLERCSVRVGEAGEKRPGWRVSFHAGRRAIDDVRGKEAVLAELAREFTCGALDVPAAVGKLRAELKARTDALAASRGELIELLAESALAASPADASGTTRIVLLRDQGFADAGLLRALAGRLAARPDVVAFCGAKVDGAAADWTVVVQRGQASSFDCGAWFKRAVAACGGRGGGRAERAEGRLGGASIDALARLG